MSQLTIDTNDEVRVLRACRNMLTELLGDVAPGQDAEDDELEDLDQRVRAEENREDDASASRGKAGDPGAGGNAPDARKDTLGVVFDPTHCGEATDPFYTSGKRAGQWKKKRGVSDEGYDAWYTSQIPGAQAKPEGDDPIDTSGAFGGGGSEPAGDPAPEDCGAFMGWVSAKQAAGLIEQEDIGNAYTQVTNKDGDALQVTDLFPPNDEVTVKQYVTELYQILVVKAGA